MAVFSFQFIDNSGFRKSWQIKAKSKVEAIDKGFQKMQKIKKGDINMWDCRLVAVLR